jgi:ABC-type antimicrobial peptide transport system permease subunit
MLALVGIAVGAVAAAFVTRVMSALLFGVQPLDLLTYTTVAVGLGVTTLVATYVPALRAARVDPAEALRWEA